MNELTYVKLNNELKKLKALWVKAIKGVEKANERTDKKAA